MAYVLLNPFDVSLLVAAKSLLIFWDLESPSYVFHGTQDCTVTASTVPSGFEAERL